MATGRRRGGRTLILVLVFVILLALIAFAVFRFGMNGGMLGGAAPQDTNAAPTVPTMTPIPENVSIVVTSGEVKRGQELSDDKLIMAEIPSSQFKEDEFFTRIEDVVGSRTLFDLKGQSPIKKSMIVEYGASNIPSFEIPKGKVAISIPVSRLSSVSNGLRKGDHVNVITTLLMVDLDTNFQSRLPNRAGYVIGPGASNPDVQTMLTAMEFHSPEYTTSGTGALSWVGRVEVDPTLNTPIYVLPGEAQRPRMVSQTLIQDAIILQMGNFASASEQSSLTVPAVEPTAVGGVAAAPGTQPTAAPAPAPSSQSEVATLIVDPQDAITLNYLMLSGANINMVMRAAGDDSRIDTEAVTLQFILDQYRIPNPAKLPYGLEPRRDEYPSNVNPFPDPVTTPTAAPQQ